MFAMQNRPDEINPWAIIIAIAPYMPILDPDSKPAIINPMWPTDE